MCSTWSITFWSQHRNRNKFKCWKDMFLKPWTTLIDACWWLKLIDWNALSMKCRLSVPCGSQGKCPFTSGWGFLAQLLCFVSLHFSLLNLNRPKVVLNYICYSDNWNPSCTSIREIFLIFESWNILRDKEHWFQKIYLKTTRNAEFLVWNVTHHMPFSRISGVKTHC